MSDLAESSPETLDYDVAIVGASLAGCASAIFLGRAGARVALVERSPDVENFKRICSHFIQASAIATLERLALLEPMEELGGVRSRARIWTRWGWIMPAPSDLPASVSLRRELLDPLIRRTAAETAGVDLMLGQTATELLHTSDAVSGVSIKDKHGKTIKLRTKLVVGADGRDSHVAQMAGVQERKTPHNRFAYGGYFEGGAPVGSPDATIWMLDPDWAAGFPTDSGLTFYAVMPTKAHLGEFREDPGSALVSFIAAVPDPPPIREGRLVGSVLGKLEMPSVQHPPASPGLALVGDAALAADPLWGVGCGWALQSAEWLSDSLAGALTGQEQIERGLRRYKRRYKQGMRGQARLLEDYATGRRLNGLERQLFSAASRNPGMAVGFEAFGTRSLSPGRYLPSAVPRALATNLRHALAGGGGRAAPQMGSSSA